MTKKAELENMAANIARALGTSVYYWKESGVHSFYPGLPRSGARQSKLIGEATPSKLYEAGANFLAGIYKGRACFDQEREQHAADRQAWADEKAEILNRMALLEESINRLKRQVGHAAATVPRL